MAFECVLLPDAGYADSLFGPDEFLHNILIGNDDERDVIYFLIVSLKPVGDLREIAFSLAAFYPSTQDVHTILSAQTAALIIPKECKAMVRGHLMSACFDLIRRLRPSRMFMCSVDVPLVAKAETKYDEIAAAAVALGYSLVKSEFDNGQKMWWMELQQGAMVDG